MIQENKQSSKQLTFVEWLLAYNFSTLLGSGSQTLKKAVHFPNTGNFILIEFVDGKEWRINYSGFQEPQFDRKSVGNSILAAYFDSILSVEVDSRTGRCLNFISIEYFENDPYLNVMLSNEDFVLVDDDYFMGSKIEMLTTYKIVEGFLVRDKSVIKNDFDM